MLKQQFLGAIDELELFHRVLSPLEIRAIAEFGKCKESVEVPWMRTTCPTWTSTMTSVTLCNDGVAPQTYQFFLAGIPASAAQGANKDGPSDYDLPSGGFFETVTLAPGVCQTFPVTMNHPPLRVGSVACYEVIAENVATGHVFKAKGLLQSSGTSYKPMVAPLDVTSIPTGSTVVVDIPIDDPGGLGGVLDWSVVVGLPDPKLIDEPGPGDTDDPGPGFIIGEIMRSPPKQKPDVLDFLELETAVVSIDGLQPGAAATGQLVIPPGGTSMVSVQVNYLAHVPFQLHELLLLADVNGNGKQEVIAAAPMRSVSP